jgi:hypothetical protein
VLPPAPGQHASPRPRRGEPARTAVLAGGISKPRDAAHPWRCWVDCVRAQGRLPRNVAWVGAVAVTLPDLAVLVLDDVLDLVFLRTFAAGRLRLALRGSFVDESWASARANELALDVGLGVLSVSLLARRSTYPSPCSACRSSSEVRVTRSSPVDRQTPALVEKERSRPGRLLLVRSERPAATSGGACSSPRAALSSCLSGQRARAFALFKGPA